MYNFFSSWKVLSQISSRKCLQLYEIGKNILVTLYMWFSWAQTVCPVWDDKLERVQEEVERLSAELGTMKKLLNLSEVYFPYVKQADDDNTYLAS